MLGSIAVVSFWELMLFGNRLLDYAIAAGMFLVLVFAFKAVQWAILRSLEGSTQRTETELDDALVAVVRLVRPPFYTFVAFYFTLRYLRIEGMAERLVTVVLLVWLVYQAIRALQIFIEYYFERRVARTDDKSAQSVTRLVRNLSNSILWAIGALFVLSNLGVDVTSLIAGLGIGGIAVALAAQNILGDLFSSLVIYLDKPFAPGDFIAFGASKGTVQEVGIKTTRIKALSGEELIVPNKEITGQLVSNFGRMKERRVAFGFGVTYDTIAEKLRNIPEIVQRIIESKEHVRFDRVHFTAFADSSLDFEAVYFLDTKKYQVHMDTHQAILLGIKDAFREAGIEMAYPTRTVHLHQS
jgi:small-conductance mechanosensitive channel